MPAPANGSPDHLRLIAKLESIGELTDQERAALAALPLRARHVPQNSDVVRDGDAPSESCLLVEGFLCRYKMLPAGSRQIQAFHTSGDNPDLQSLHLTT